MAAFEERLSSLEDRVMGEFKKSASGQSDLKGMLLALCNKHNVAYPIAAPLPIPTELTARTSSISSPTLGLQGLSMKDRSAPSSAVSASSGVSGKPCKCFSHILISDLCSLLV
jgi:hypothetical protein